MQLCIGNGFQMALRSSSDFDLFIVEFEKRTSDVNVKTVGPNFVEQILAQSWCDSCQNEKNDTPLSQSQSTPAQNTGNHVHNY